MNAKEQNLATVQSALSRSRTGAVILSVVILGLAWLMAPVADGQSSVGYTVAGWGMAGFFVLIAGVLLWVAFYKQSPKRSPLILALRDRPDDVVWVYRKDFAVSVEGTQVPGAVRDCNVMASLADGSTCALVVSKEKADGVFAALVALAPRAATGFSDARLEDFKRAPRSLLDTGSAAG